ncbi:MAG: hypothetical protein Q9174_005204 [Haloplaca sp. 1 TL-2023]
MCFFKFEPKHAPLKPPGAAPTLTSLDEHYRITLAGQLEDPNKAMDPKNKTKSLDVNEKLEPNRPVLEVPLAAAEDRKMSLPVGSRKKVIPR